MLVNRSPAFFELAKAAKMRGGLPTLSGRPMRHLSDYAPWGTRSNGKIRGGRRWGARPTPVDRLTGGSPVCEKHELTIQF